MAKKGIIIFAGSNRFALERERRRWEREFCERHGEENLLRKSGTGLTLRALLDDVAVAPFLSENRLVIIDGIPKFTKEEIELLVAHRHPSTILLFLDKPTRGSKGPPKDLVAEAEVKTFAELKGPQLQTWIAERAAHHGLALTNDAKKRLCVLLQNDQDFLETEIEKLALQFPGKTVDVKDLDGVVLPLEGAVWAVTDAVVAGRPEQAVLEARRLLHAGADPMMLWNAVLSFIHSTLQVAAAIDDGVSSAPAVAERTGIHPFVARNLFPFAKNLPRPRLRALVGRASEFDRALKTGLLKSSDEGGDTELTAATDALLLGFR